MNRAKILRPNSDLKSSNMEHVLQTLEFTLCKPKDKPFLEDKTDNIPFI